MKIVHGPAKYFSDDGKEWTSKKECEDYEWSEQLKKYGLSEFSREQLTIGHGLAVVDHLPYEAPWMNAFGSCAVKVYEVKSIDGVVKFGVGNEQPPILGWVNANDFYSEWPK